jgi:hypothetical protein
VRQEKDQQQDRQVQQDQEEHVVPSDGLPGRLAVRPHRRRQLLNFARIIEQPGIPYSIDEARKAANCIPMDTYLQHLMLWLCDEVELLQKVEGCSACFMEKYHGELSARCFEHGAGRQNP